MSHAQTSLHVKYNWDEVLYKQLCDYSPSASDTDAQDNSKLHLDTKANKK